MNSNIPKTMHAVVLTGHGGFDKMEYRTDVPVPSPKNNEVLIRVTAAGVNNTDINTRIGWYSKSVTSDTNKGGEKGLTEAKNDDGSWSGIPLQFPRIQGADVCGHIVSVGSDVDSSRIGERVIARTIQTNPNNPNDFSCWTLGSECDGAFAQYTIIRSSETFALNCNWSDAELASLPCAYSTAEGLLHRSKTGAEKIFITGASGGVGSAAIQLAKLRGAHITAQCSFSKHTEVKKIGADAVVNRNADLIKELGLNIFDVVIDVVAGSNWPQLLEILKPGGRYATSGAIAGPITELDVRTLYLKDLTFYGCTFQPVEVFKNLISYVEHNKILPLVSKTYPLDQIKQAQEDFLAKKHIGKLVLIPSD